MCFRIFTLFFILFLSNNLLAVEDLTIREAINKATRQQTLTQRIAKVYLALNNNLYEPTFYQERDAAIELFQNQLDELKWYTPTDKIKASLKHVRVLWKDYKAVADWSINEEGAVKLLKLCDEILFASNQLFVSYEEYAKQINEGVIDNDDMLSIIKLLETTGHLSMLPQRIMLFYLAAKQSIEPSAAKRKLNVEIQNYNALLEFLEKSPISSTAIKGEVSNMKKDWSQLSKQLSNFKNTTDDVNQMMLLADNLSKNANQVSTLYEDLGLKLSISKAINISAYQNMLTQRIAKAYVAITYGYSPAKYKRELLASIDLFEDQMKSMIRSSNATDEFKAAVGVVKTMWKNYRKLVTTWDNMDEISVVKVLEKGHVIMATCDRVAQEIQNYAQTIPDYKAFFVKEDGKAVDDKENIAHQMHLAGLQRVYSQRIAIYFTMKALEVDTRLSEQRMKATIDNYKANFKSMSNSSINNHEIIAELKETQKQWEIIELHCSDPQKDDIPNILEQCAILFNQLNQLNTLYEQHMDKMFMQKK